MSIIKSILHKYNATSKAYDTLHPETESAQITDWHKAVVNSLASTTLPAVVSALTTDSVMGKLMKLLLNASGVKYLIDTNGYVCFGDFFGGLIIQWGSFFNVNGLSVFTYPLGLSSKPYEIITTEGDPSGWNTGNGIVVSGADITTASNTQANILSKWVNNGGAIVQGGATVRVLIIGH